MSLNQNMAKSKIVLYEYIAYFIVYIKVDDNFRDIAEDLETKFSTSNYELDTPLIKGKKQKK